VGAGGRGSAALRLRGALAADARPPTLLVWIAAVGLVVSCLSVVPPAPLAHVGGSTGYASIVVSGNTVRYSLTLSASALPPAVAEEVARVRAGRPDSRDRLLGHLRDKLALVDQGRRCEPAQGFVDAGGAEADRVTLVMDFACASDVRELSIRDDLFDVLGPDHHTLAKIESGGEIRELAFATEAREARISFAARQPSREEGSFFRLGIEHILTGYDHLLFLGALLLRGGRLLSLFKIITAFTVAHSITLALAVLGLVAIPERLVECVIAASIVYVALENVFLRDAPSQRWVVSFLFGLVHGFGFASALNPLHLPPRHLALALLGFNLGVESGQALVVALLLPILVWMRGSHWERRAVQTASGAVALLGFIWFFERLFLV
jgi:hydrogenase/urease accessory protein HupE